MATCEEMRDDLFAYGRVVDGYNGAWLDVGFHLDPQTGHTYCVTPHGSFAYRRPGCYVDTSRNKEEAYFNLELVEPKYLVRLSHWKHYGQQYGLGRSY